MKVERSATPPPATFLWKMIISKIQPRFTRQKKGHEFFAVSRGYFDKNIRPFLTEIWWGDTPQSGISYDVLEMNALADKIVERNGRPAKKGEETWDVKQKVPVLKLSKSSDLPTGISTVPSTEDELDKVLAQTMHRQQK